MGQRRKAREIAIQCLYSLEFSEVDKDYREYGLLNEYPATLLSLATGEGLEPDSPVYAFADELIKNTIINIDQIESEIDKIADNRDLQDIAWLDRSILCVATYELLFTDTPAPVIINEAIEIAKKYSSEVAGKFINGILDGINKAINQSRSQNLPI